MRKLTTQEFLEKAILVHGNRYDYSNVVYVRNRDKICIICRKHGEFLQTPNAHLNGQNCPKCRGKNSSVGLKEKEILKLKTTTVSLIEKLKKVHGEQYDYSLVEYTGSYNKIKVICRLHGEFLISLYHHLKGSGCKICNGGGSQYITEDFIKKAKDVHGDTYDYSKVNYLDKDTLVTIICKKHGEFQQKPHNHICGCGCQTCKVSFQQNKLLKKLQDSFLDEVVQTEISPTWLEKQRFDIYFPNYNIAVEYNGEQHYKIVAVFGGEEGFIKTQNRDILKREKCKLNNCSLFEIKYGYNNNDYEQLVLNIKTIIKNYTNESIT